MQYHHRNDRPVIVGSDEDFAATVNAVFDRLLEADHQMPPPLDPSRSFLRPAPLAVVDAEDVEQARTEILRLERALNEPLIVVACRFAPETLRADCERVSLVKHDENLAETLYEVVRWTLAGYSITPRPVTRKPQIRVDVGADEEVRLRMLSPTECRVLMLVAEAKSNKLIAREMRISDNTVRVHMRSIFIKLGVENRTQAALLATRFRHCDLWQSKVVDLLSAVAV